MLLFTSSFVRHLRNIGNCKAAGEDMENELRPQHNHFRFFFRLRSLVYPGALAHWCAVPGRFSGALVLSTVAAQPITIEATTLATCCP